MQEHTPAWAVYAFMAISTVATLALTWRGFVILRRFERTEADMRNWIAEDRRIRARFISEIEHFIGKKIL